MVVILANKSIVGKRNWFSNLKFYDLYNISKSYK